MEPKNAQRLKLLYLYELLSRVTDEKHPLSTEEIIQELRKQGVVITARMLPLDIECLNQCGYAVESYKRRIKYYYVRNSKLEASDIFMLVNMLSETKSDSRKNMLMKKLVSMEKTGRAEFFSKNMMYQKVTSGDEYLTYVIDILDTAISSKRKVSFRRFTFDPYGCKDFTYPFGELFVNPLVLLWNGKRHYLIGYSDEGRKLRAYRLDRMEEVKMTDFPIQPLSKNIEFRPEGYRTALFALSLGESCKVTLEFEESISDEIFDRFGTDIHTFETDDGKFGLSTETFINDEFFSWIVSCLGKVRLKEPSDIVKRFEEFVKQIKTNF